MAFLLQDLLKLVSRHISNLDHHESIFESFRELFTTTVALCWVLSGKDPEVGVSFDNFLSLNNVEFSIVVE